MMGWWIKVSQQTPEELDACKFDSERRDSGNLATWEAGVGGDSWIKKLVEQGVARQIQFDGYPNRFVAEAGAVLPLIANGPPESKKGGLFGDGHWTVNIRLHQDKMLACPPTQMLTIETLDQS